MIVVTGAAGFIGSCLAGRLNADGYKDLVLVDDFSTESKQKNYFTKTFSQLVDREMFHAWLRENHKLVQFVFHLGARTDTTEQNTKIFDHLNLSYSKEVWNNCVEFGLPLVYASSAATYGEGETGYDDDETKLGLLKPLNPYGISKNEFDKWAISQQNKPYCWAGLKFFNVYGPNEYHKGRMASVVFHAFNQVNENGRVKLFRSHRKDFEDGKQLRDFVYVKDVVAVCMFFLLNRKASGIYNLGSGNARSFLDLATATFINMKKPVLIDYIDIPADIREKYQYYTQANIEKLRSTGYTEQFHTLEEGIADYINHYLVPQKHA